MEDMQKLRDDNYRRRGMLVETGMSDDELAVKMRRCGGGVTCDQCGKLFYDHPYIHEARDQDGGLFLHLLCDGTIAKL